MLWTAAEGMAWSGDKEGTANEKQQQCTLTLGFSKAEGRGNKVAPAASTASDCPSRSLPSNQGFRISKSLSQSGRSAEGSLLHHR